MRTSLVVAADENDVIGLGDGLPWHLPEDLRRFKRLTLGHAVVVGRRTHEGIVARLGHPLPGRLTVVVSGRDVPGTVAVQRDPRAALALARAVEEFAGREEVFVIGGAQVYAALLDAVDRIYLTRVHRESGGDTAMPPGWLSGFTVTAKEPGDGYTFLTYERG
jgi:dihydrofolate reductase